MARIRQTVMGVADMDRAMRFWREALGYVQRESAYHPNWNVLVPPPERQGAHLALVLTEAPSPDRPRMHIDLDPDGGDAKAEIERLVALGASVVDWEFYPADADFVVLSDPEGNRFCVIDPTKHA
jgi:predicted enzyme related to lactoylglutathione lyase